MFAPLQFFSIRASCFAVYTIYINACAVSCFLANIPSRLLYLPIPLWTLEHSHIILYRIYIIYLLFTYATLYIFCYVIVAVIDIYILHIYIC